jgi:bacteriocin biosynthesis cyclodehydratase domain-containing protein
MAARRAPTLPRLIRLRPHRSLLRRGPTARQFGLDPRTALAVDDLPRPLALMLDELVAPADRVDLVARAVRRGADAGAAEDLLRRLVDAGVLVDAAAVERLVRRRAEATVAVAGDGPLAVGLAAGLAVAAVGTLQLAAGSGGPVRARDVGTGLLDGDRGRPRGEALADAVRRVVPGARAGPQPTRPSPCFYVLADAAAPDPVLVAELHATRIAHLPVRLRDGVGVVGPLVLPGRSACLGCLELHRRGRDPGWPAVAAQLMNREGSGEPATAAATAALGVAQVLAALDAAAGSDRNEEAGSAAGPPALGATLELDLAAGVLLRRRWSGHPDCTCGAPPSEKCGPRDGRGRIME